jgi:hypothetical protein
VAKPLSSLTRPLGVTMSSDWLVLVRFMARRAASPGAPNGQRQGEPGRQPMLGEAGCRGAAVKFPDASPGRIETSHGVRSPACGLKRCT